jgi:hypothetical protein
MNRSPIRRRATRRGWRRRGASCSWPRVEKAAAVEALIAGPSTEVPASLGGKGWT